jgi:hypothetical protein
MAKCRKCGGEESYRMSLGSGRVGPACSCPLPAARSEARPRSTPNKPSSRLSVAEQLVLLVKLYEKGALSEQEFEILKSKLIAQGT